MIRITRGRRGITFGLLVVLCALSCSRFTGNLALPPAAASFAASPATSHGGPLLTQDFNAANPWPRLSAAASPAKGGVTASAAWKPVGTVDVAESTTASGAIVLSVDAPAHATWGAQITSGLLPVRTTEANLSKLTLSFDHAVSSVRPVTVRIESFDAQRRRTGGREAIVYPAAPNFYLRSAVELSAMRAVGGGAFRPQDPFVQITFALSGLPDETAAHHDLRIDNVAYASPAFYVSPTGSDANDGRTEKTPLADPQKAVELAQPGDIILLMEGTFHRAPTSSVHEGIIAFHHGGTPAAWIVVKNYPGQHPTLTSDAWCTIKIGREQDQPAGSPTLAYLEVRGLHLRGIGDTFGATHPELIDQVNPLTNGNGISGNGHHEAVPPHHLRFADNLIEYCCGNGVGTGDCDWVTIENNITRNNCWWVIYATSGTGLLGIRNFDATANVYKCLIRNNVISGNRCFRKWKSAKRVSDGNGIIIDTNYLPKQGKAYLGRTLIQGNLTFNNGGSGIHTFRSHQVDIINNTAYYNGASPELRWGQIFVQEGDDVKMINNILVSRPDQPINSCGPGGGDQNSTNIIRSNNVYFGGLTPKFTGPGDVIADPLFVRPSTDFRTADFHLQTSSPAHQKGDFVPFLPYLDLDNKPRGTTPSRGAYR